MYNVDIEKMTTVKGGRKRAFNVAGLLVASAVAMTVKTAVAFQCASGPGRSHHKDMILSQRFVVTDPSRLIRMDLPDNNDSDRKTLEDIYLLTSDADGLSGELIEDTPVKSVARKKVGKARKKAYDNLERSQVQFRGLTVAANQTQRKQRKPIDSTPATKGRVNLSNKRASKARNRSSTMPGFMERSSSDRRKAFKDGIKLAEHRSGKKFVETADAKKQRKKETSISMYQSSASVPDSMVQFAGEIHEIERISPKEEVVLGEKTQEAVRLQKIYDGLIEQLEREPTDEEWCAASGKINMEAITQAIDDGLEAKNKLVTSNLRMVQGVVNVYIRNGLRGQYNAGDLMQEGIVALIRAAEKFDPSRGFRFSTYAMYWIRSAIKRNQIYQSRVMTVPQRLYENHKRIRRVQGELTAKLDRPPTKAELAEAVGMSQIQIDRCVAAMAQRCYSLDQQVSNPFKPYKASNERDSMYDLVECRVDESSSNKLEHMFMKDDLVKALRRHLTKEEADLVLLRYGLNDSPVPSLKSGPLTIAEVSRIVGLKPDKVRRIINKSLKQLKILIGKEWREYEREL